MQSQHNWTESRDLRSLNKNRLLQNKYQIPALYSRYKGEIALTESEEMNFGFVGAKQRIFWSRIIFTFCVSLLEYVATNLVSPSVLELAVSRSKLTS